MSANLMEKLTERQEFIMLALVPEYINRAVPIGSEFLAGHYGFGVKPATIRNELVELTKKGYLEQPHTSAGRIPTDTGYRFYVNTLLDEDQKNTKETKKRQLFFEYIKEVEDKEDSDSLFVKILNEFSDNLVWSIEEGDGPLMFEGLRKIFQHPEFQNIGAAEQFFKTFDTIRSEVEHIVRHVEETKQNIFIGQEIEVLPHHDYSSIISSFALNNGSTIWVSFFGPKRMRYREHLEFIGWLREYFE